jgi:hypothetical protein
MRSFESILMVLCLHRILSLWARVIAMPFWPPSPPPLRFLPFFPISILLLFLNLSQLVDNLQLYQILVFWHFHHLLRQRSKTFRSILHFPKLAALAVNQFAVPLLVGHE